MFNRVFCITLLLFSMFFMYASLFICICIEIYKAEEAYAYAILMIYVKI